MATATASRRPGYLGHLPLALLAARGWLPRGAVLSSSKLETCLNDGSEQLECDKKVVLTVTLEHGQQETETAQFTISQVTAAGGDEPVQLQKPWLLTWTKSAAHWRYPITYVQDVNNKPTETILHVGWNACRDNPSKPTDVLTCGVAEQGGKVVPDSEGFCCGCDGNDLFSGTPTRGDLDCPLQESAHCLHWDALWYMAFEVGPPQVAYDITVGLAKPDDPSASWRNLTYTDAKLELSHQKPLAQAEGGDLIVQLVGDFATASAPHSFESRYLVVPKEPSDHARVDQDQPLKHAMLVDKAKFDLSGLSCDKIGVSYSAFKWQASPCDKTPNYCLGSQLEDIYQEDQDRLRRGLSPLSLASGFCGGAVEVGASGQQSAGTTFFLACPMEQRHTTVLRVEVRAEDVMFITNVASGSLVKAEASSFEALSGAGEVHLIVVSTGKVVADFTVGVADCSAELTAGPAVTTSLSPWESSEHRIPLFFSQTDGGDYTCVATLYNAVGAIEDQKIVQVNVTDVQRTFGAQVPTERDGVNASGEREYTNCEELCPSLVDLLCFLAHGCWGRLGTAAASLGLAIAACCCLCLAVKHGLLCKLVACCCPSPASLAARSHAAAPPMQHPAHPWMSVTPARGAPVYQVGMWRPQPPMGKE